MKKYILLLFTALSFAQASNQMVSFTQAQSLGFALNAGQSHVTSNQCMTKSDALAKYNLDASAMSSYASNQLVPKSTWVSGVVSYVYTMSSGYGIDVSATCTVYEIERPTNLYSSSSSIQLPMTFYSDPNLTVIYNANGLDYYYYDGNQLLTINNSGVLTAIAGCGDITSPTPPNFVTASAQGYNIELFWSGATDNVGVTNYNIYRNSSLLESNIGNYSNYIDYSVCDGTHYYQIQAVDAAGNVSSLSDPEYVNMSGSPFQCQ